MSTTNVAVRRTQTSRRDCSQSLILDAAVELLVESGYCRTTTVAIQARAGVTRGRLLHHYPSRDALLVAAAHHLADEQIVEMAAWFEQANDPNPGSGERIDRAISWLWTTFRQPYFWAAMELWCAARTDETLRNELAAAEPRLGRAIQHVIATMFGPVHSSHAAFSDVCELIFSSMRGVALTYSIAERDHETDSHLTLWRTVARKMLEVALDGE